MDETRGHQQGSLSGPTLSIVSYNIEALTCAKQDLLAELCSRNNCDILCIEVLSIELMWISVSSVYKPPIETFSLPNAVTDGCVNVVIGDFNSHSVTWGYGKTNEDGEIVENWADANQMSLIPDAKLPYSSNSCRGKRGYNPDLMFVSNNIANQCEKVVLDPIPHSQHRPIGLKVNAVITPRTVPFRRRFNLKKAHWGKFCRRH